MIISQSRRFVFVHVHKTAGEAVTLALLPYLGRGDLVLGTTIGGKLRDIHHRRARGISKHSSALALRAYLGPEAWEGCFSFAFVRHPFDRIQSFYAYLGMMVDRRRGPGLRNVLYAMPFFERGDPLRWPAIQAYLATGGFSEFIRHPAFLTDPGARSQHAMLADGEGRVLVDFVGRFERLTADFARVTARLGLPEVTLPKHNASPTEDGQMLLAAEDRDLLAELYAKDFEAFRFARDPADPAPGARWPGARAEADGGP